MNPMKRKATKSSEIEIDEEVFALEEEELDGVRPAGEIGSSAGSPAEGRGQGRDLVDPPRRVAFFALGALFLFLAMGLLGVAFTQPYYEVDVRDGPQPEGEDRSNRHVMRLHLGSYVYHFYRGGDGSPTRSDETWIDAPVVGIAMKQLAWTGYIGIGLIGLAFLAGVLHRLGALTVPGPAPILAVFGGVALFAGLIPFMMEIAHHARVEWIPGRLDLHPMFFTMNADGDRVHDLYMGPLLGFWLHAGAAVAAVAGTVMMFLGDLKRAAVAVRRFAEGSEATFE